MTARRLARHLAQLAMYVAGPAVSALAPLVVIPAVTSRYGAAGWSSVAVALSIGLAGAVVGELGWAIVGPQRVARDRSTAAAVYDRALASRIVAVGILAAPVGIASGMLAAEHRAAAVLLGLGVLLGAMSPSWYWTGLGRPGTILRLESLPRMLLALAAAVAIACGAPLETYGAALCIAAALAVVLSARAGRIALWPSASAFRTAGATIREQAVVMAGRSISTLYKALPTALLAGVAPTAVAPYSAVDRPLRMGLQFLAVVPQRLQVWIGVEDHALRSRRATRSILLNVALGGVAGLATTLLLPALVRVLFTGVVHVGPTMAIAAGALVAVVCATRGFGLALVAVDRADVTAWAATASAVVGLPGAILGGTLAGAEGTMTALVLAEAAGVIPQWIVLARRGRRFRAVVVGGRP
jgi:O-antigen/teichoic acid export membrane protein